MANQPTHPFQALQNVDLDTMAETKRYTRRDMLKMMAALQTAYFFKINDADAFTWLLRLILGVMRVGRLGRVARAARVIPRVAPRAGAGMAALTPSQAFSRRVLSTTSKAHDISFLLDTFEWILPDVIDQMTETGAEAVWVNDSLEVDLFNVINVQTRSENDSPFTDKIIVEATDFHNGNRDLLFKTMATTLPNRINDFEAKVTRFPSNGTKIITAHFENDHGKHYFAEKKVIITDHKNVKVKA